MNDWELIERFVRERDEEAFAGLVRRHGGFVLASARRQVGADLGEEVVQAVFLVLARKASSLNSQVVLSSWLFRTTGYVVAQVRRRESRRVRREQETVHMIPQEGGGSVEADELRGRVEEQLDAALVALSERDREYVLSRFVERRKFGEIGERFGVTEDAAKKRVLRAVEKIRGFLEGKGIALSAVALGGFLTGPRAEAFPAQLARRIADSIAWGGRGGPGGGVAELAEGAVREGVRMGWRQLWVRWGVVGSAAALMVATVGSWPLSAPARLPRDAAAVAPTAKGDLASAGGGAASSRGSAQVTSLTLTLVNDETGEPVQGAGINVTRVPSPPPVESARFVSDDGGRSEIPLDRRSDFFTKLWIRAPGFMPAQVGWVGYALDSDHLRYTCRLIPGRKFSGELRGPGGEPVIGAEVQIGADAQRVSQDYEDGILEYSVRTDAQGRFFTDEFPRFRRASPMHPQSSGEPRENLVTIKVNAVGYVSEGWELTNTLELPNPWVARLQLGETLRGVITDVDDVPVAGAKVFAMRHVGRNQSWASPDTGVATDSLGEFAISNIDSSHFRGIELFVRAKGYLPWGGKMYVLPPEALPRVERGDSPPPPSPAVGGWVAEETDGLRRPIRIEQVGPADEGLRAVRVRVPLTASGTAGVGVDAVGQSSPSPRLRAIGKVVDSISGLPLRQFRVVLQAVGFGRASFLGEGHDGAFDWLLPQHYPSTALLEVEAPGHLAAPPIRSEETPEGRVMLFELPPAIDIVGRVESPAGAAVVAAQVAWVGEDTFFGWTEESGWAISQGVGRATRSDDHGEFRLQPTGREKSILVLHEDGCALKPVGQLGGAPLRLLPWAKVEGMLTERDVPIAGATVTLVANLVPPPNQPVPFRLSYRAKTDALGRFAFSRVPPGRFSVEDGVTSETVSVTPGETPSVRLRR